MRAANVLFQKPQRAQLLGHFHSLTVRLGQIQTSDKEQFLIAPIRARADIEVCVFPIPAHGCISARWTSVQERNFDAFQCKKQRPLHWRFVGLRPEFCRSAALRGAAALLRSAGKWLFPGPSPTSQQSALVRGTHRRGGEMAAHSPRPCLPRSEAASSLGCNIWCLPEAWVVGMLPGCGVRVRPGAVAESAPT